MPHPRQRRAKELRQAFGATQRLPESSASHVITAPSSEFTQTESRFQVAIRVVLWTLLAASVSCLAIYHFRTYRFHFHSDSASKNIWASEILRTGHFFAPHFNYVNDFPVFFGHLFILAFALLGANPNTYFMNALAAFIGSVLLLVTIAFFYRTGRASPESRLLGLALVMSGFSERLLEIVFGQNAYGPVAIEVILALTLAYWVLYRAENGVRVYLCAAASSILIAVASMSGPRAFMSICAPLGLTVLLSMLLEIRSALGLRKLARPVALLTLAYLIGTALGTSVFFYARNHTAYSNPNVAQTFATPGEMGSNLSLFLSGTLYYFGALPIAGRTPYSFYGLLTAYRLPVMIVLNCLPFVLFARYRRVRNGFLRFVVLFYVVNFSCLLYFYMFSHVAQTIESYRYFSVSIVIGLALAALAIEEIPIRARHTVVTLVIIGLLPVFFSTYALTGFDAFNQISPVGSGSGSRPDNPHDPIARVLVAKHLQYGYATYWNSAVVTVLSAGRSQVRQVLLTGDGRFLPFRFHSSNDWYEPDYYNGPTFLMIGDEEAPRVDFSTLSHFCGEPQTRIQGGSFTVLVYPLNIAACVPGWYLNPAALELNQPLFSFNQKITSSTHLPLRMQPSQTMWIPVVIQNTGRQPWVSRGKAPVDVSYKWFKDGKMLPIEGERTMLPQPVAAGTSLPLDIRVVAPQASGHLSLSITLVQEGVAWFLPSGGELTVPVNIP